MTPPIGKKTDSSISQPKLRRPVYNMDGKDMKVTYYDGEGHWKNTVFENNKIGKLAQSLTKFINKNAFNGNIKANDMKSAWDRAQSLYAPLNNSDHITSYEAETRVLLLTNMQLERMDKLMDNACKDGVVTQQEQFTIMNALANWFGTE